MLIAETLRAEKVRRKPFVEVIGKCPDCLQPVTQGQEYIRFGWRIRHALCFYDRAHAKRVRELALKKPQ